MVAVYFIFLSCNKSIERKQLNISKLFCIYGNKTESLHHVFFFFLSVMEMYLNMSHLDVLGYLLLIFTPRKLLCYMLEYLISFVMFYCLSLKLIECKIFYQLLRSTRSRHRYFNICFYLEKGLKSAETYLI